MFKISLPSLNNNEESEGVIREITEYSDVPRKSSTPDAKQKIRPNTQMAFAARNENKRNIKTS